MSDSPSQRPGRLIDRAALPAGFPTHRPEPVFWEHLGRCVAAFGFLEWTLQRAVFALTGDRPAPEDEEERRAALHSWTTDLEGTLRSTLSGLSRQFEAAAATHPTANSTHASAVARDIRDASVLRNALCHAWWNPAGAAAADPVFVNRELQVMSGRIDIPWLVQTHSHVAALACDVIDTVTDTGLPFPGGGPPDPEPG